MCELNDVQAQVECSLTTFLLGLDSVFDGADGSKTGLVFRLLLNFFLFRLSAANAPNPFEKDFKWNFNERQHLAIFSYIYVYVYILLKRKNMHSLLLKIYERK